MDRRSVRVIHVGSPSRDVGADDPRGWRLGGGAAFGALATARLGIRTGAILGLDPVAQDADELAWLRDAGVEVVVAPLAEGPVFENLETPAGRVQTALAVGRPVDLTAVPAAWRSVGAWSFAPVADELDDAWSSVPPPGAVVAVGWQGMLRDLRAGTLVARRPPAERALLRRADLVGVSELDLPPGTEPLYLRRFLAPSARLAVTRAQLGGLVASPSHVGRGIRACEFAAIPTATEVDPTGAGDVFLATWLATTLDPSLAAPDAPDAPGHDETVTALRMAAAAASLTVERAGLAAVPDRAAVLARAETVPLAEFCVPLGDR